MEISIEWNKLDRTTCNAEKFSIFKSNMFSLLNPSQKAFLIVTTIKELD